MLTLMQVSQGHVQDNPSAEFNQANGSSAPGACCSLLARRTQNEIDRVVSEIRCELEDAPIRTFGARWPGSSRFSETGSARVCMGRRACRPRL